jgi:very-short-patch-repair endonuclease
VNKKDYILKQLGRTDKKDLENYCITGIYHRLDRKDVRFNTQQLFRRSDNQIALADLYLPQINLIIEIDEDHHLKRQKEDSAREEEMIVRKLKAFEDVVTHQVEVKRIKNKASIEKINDQIEDIVNVIRNKIDELGNEFIPWNASYPNPKYYIEKGYIDTAERPSFMTLQDVSELFNKGYHGNQHAWFSGRKGSNIWVWCPRLSVNGETYNQATVNEITDDGQIIYEYWKDELENKGKIEDVIDGEQKDRTIRYTFAYFKDSSGESRYRFRGIFKLNKERTIKEQKRVWEKISDRVDLGEYH